MQVLIVEGETGSGKTTQIPQYLYEAVSVTVCSVHVQYTIFFSVSCTHTSGLDFLFSVPKCVHVAYYSHLQAVTLNQSEQAL